jgi:hypothetical protein
MKKAYLDHLYKEREIVEKEIEKRKQTLEKAEGFTVDMLSKTELVMLEFAQGLIDSSISKYIEVHAPEL